jgi:hypothetical protein
LTQPKSIPEPRFLILQGLTENKELNTKELTDYVISNAKISVGLTVDAMRKLISNAKTNGWLDSRSLGHRNVAYFLTDQGKALYRPIVKNPELTRIVPYHPIGAAKPEKTITPPAQQDLISIPEVMAPEADLLMDNISKVVNKNMQYRKMMVDIRNLIDRKLGEIEGDNNG